MMTRKQIRMLELLDNLISDCKECSLHKNGRCLPYWTPYSKYLIVGEAPGADEVDNEPFVGKAGKILWESMNEFNIRKEEFAIINTVQCRPVNNGRNGKPSPMQMKMCYKWVRKFMTVVDPIAGMALGNYPNDILFGQSTGIINRNGHNEWYEINDREIVFIQSVHPAYCIYNATNGKSMLERSIKELKRFTQ